MSHSGLGQDAGRPVGRTNHSHTFRRGLAAQHFGHLVVNDFDMERSSRHISILTNLNAMCMFSLSILVDLAGVL